MSSSGGGGISIPANPQLGSGAMGSMDAQTSSDIRNMPSFGASRFLSGPLDAGNFINQAPNLAQSLLQPYGTQMMVDPGSIPGQRGNFPGGFGQGLLGSGKPTPFFRDDGLIL